MTDPEIIMLDPDESQFTTLLRSVGGEANAEITHHWIEDDCVPYTVYDRARDIAKLRRLEWLRRQEGPS